MRTFIITTFFLDCLTSVPGSITILPQASLFSGSIRASINLSQASLGCNPSLCTSSSHTCRACYLQDSEDPSPGPEGLRGCMCPSLEQLWQIQLDLGSGKCSRGLFFRIVSEQCRVWHVRTGVVFYEIWIIQFIVPVWLTLAGFNNGFKARAQLWFSVHHMKRRVVIERESEEVYLTLPRERGSRGRPRSSDLTHSNHDVTCYMNSNQSEQRFEGIIL